MTDKNTETSNEEIKTDPTEGAEVLDSENSRDSGDSEKNEDSAHVHKNDGDDSSAEGHRQEQQDDDLTVVQKCQSRLANIPRKYLYLALALVGMAVVLGVFMMDRHNTLSLRGKTMGTTWLVKVVSEQSLDKTKLQGMIDNTLEKANAIASTYRKDSQITAFNTSESTDWIAVDSFLVANVAVARDVWTLSEGRYDITIAPLIDLWGFDAKGRVEKMPDVFALADVREKIGMEKLDFRTNPPALRKKDPHVSINLSSIAKGAAIDVIVDNLESKGIHNYLVEIGGEIRAKGLNDKGTLWTVGIEVPDALRGSIQRAVPLDNMALATSGDYRNYFEENGRRYSHIIDAIRGVPVSHKLASVSVFAETTIHADALATMLFVLGEEKGLKVANDNNINALFVVRDGNGFEEVATEAYEKQYGEKTNGLPNK